MAVALLPAVSAMGVTRRRGDIPLWAAGAIDLARHAYEAAPPLFRKAGDRRGIGLALGELGILAHLVRDFGRARLAFEQSFVELHAIRDHAFASTMATHLASTYWELEQWEKSRSCALDAIRLAEESLNQTALADATQALEQAMTKVGARGAVQAALSQAATHKTD